ncbi:hypothetical protein VPH35_039596 [Triticum aestivum]
MPCRRESRSAMSAWRLRPLMLFLFLLPRGALSQIGRGLALPPSSPMGFNITCNSIDYPFGIEGIAQQPGFEVTCGRNSEAMLQIDKHSYKIDYVSVEEGFVVVLAGPIHQVCYDRNGKQMKATGIGNISLEQTPFTFSKSNKLVATGCNYKLVAKFSNSSDGESFCSTSCDEYSGTVDCIHGLACCEVPMPMNTTREFTFKFDKIEEQDIGYEDGTCSAAFFLDQGEQVFMGGRGNAQRPLKDMLLPAVDHRMILDWAVGRGTCHQASTHNLARRYCNKMSGCIDAPSGAGHLCKCHAGYDGNPYVADGCVDIDECRTSDSNNCTIQDFCHNTRGGYTCSCPNGWIGDGYLTGTNCSEALSPSGVGLALVVIISSTALCCYWGMKRRKVRRKRAELFRKNGGLLLQQRFTAITSQGKDSSAKIFSAEELKTATNNYNETRILGRGAYGTVYKGVLPDETVVAVKKSRVFDESQVEQFVNEITILSQTDHPNVVKLLGCCLEIEVPLLVYEFIPNGTLFQHIHNRSAPRSLTWEDTLRIAAEAAEALAYLHSTSSIPIIHRDIKSSNILLDENFVAKISDFGASRSVPFDQTHVTTLIQGTIGYLDPEYFQSSQLTEKSDVYSFGVVLAELLTRQKPISVGRPEESCNLAMHMVILVNEGRLLKEIEPDILAEAGEEQVYAVAQLSVRCLNMNGQERPIMKEVASVLEGLRRSFTNDKEQTMRRTDEPAQKYNEQGHLLREASSTSNLHYSEGSTQLSMEAEMKASCHTPR